MASNPKSSQKCICHVCMCVSVQVDRPAYFVPTMSLHIQVHQCLVVLQFHTHQLHRHTAEECEEVGMLMHGQGGSGDVNWNAIIEWVMSTPYYCNGHTHQRCWLHAENAVYMPFVRVLCCRLMGNERCMGPPVPPYLNSPNRKEQAFPFHNFFTKFNTTSCCHTLRWYIPKPSSLHNSNENCTFWTFLSTQSKGMNAIMI